MRIGAALWSNLVAHLETEARGHARQAIALQREAAEYYAAHHARERMAQFNSMLMYEEARHEASEALRVERMARELWRCANVGSGGES